MAANWLAVDARGGDAGRSNGCVSTRGRNAEEGLVLLVGEGRRRCPGRKRWGEGVWREVSGCDGATRKWTYLPQAP